MESNEEYLKKMAHEQTNKAKQDHQAGATTNRDIGDMRACGVARSCSIGYALDWLKAGRRVMRRGWNGNGIFIELQVPDSNSKMSAPYIFIDTTGLRTDNPGAPRVRVPWVPSQTDMLAEDWQTA